MKKESVKQHCIVVAIAGLPNAGKSTLVNQMVGQKIAIVSPKAQTTRSRTRGVCMAGDTQIILVDTPGIFNAHKGMNRAMVETAWREVHAADLVLLLIDARKQIGEELEELITLLMQKKTRVIAVLNKVDDVEKQRLLPLSVKLNALGTFEAIFMVSALTGDGVSDVVNFVVQRAPEAPWMFDPEQVSDVPGLLFLAEITREKLFLNLQQELPYSVLVETEKVDDAAKAMTVHQTVYVGRESHKQMVIGKQGATLKRIGQQARQELESIYEKKVHLFLHVKVKENWDSDPQNYRLIGLDGVS